MSRALSSVLIAVAIALAGCGGGSDSSDSTNAKSSGDSVPAARGAKVPEGASPTLREIYRQFPPPKANPTVAGSAAAIKAGEAACEGSSPLQVKEAFYAEAVEQGGLEADGSEAEMIAKLPSYEKYSSRDSSFTAGQLAADVYQATLPEAIAQFGFQGCIYSLARRLEGELAPGG